MYKGKQIVACAQSSERVDDKLLKAERGGKLSK